MSVKPRTRSKDRALLEEMAVIKEGQQAGAKAPRKKLITVETTVVESTGSRPQPNDKELLEEMVKLKEGSVISEESPVTVLACGAKTSRKKKNPLKAEAQKARWAKTSDDAKPKLWAAHVRQVMARGQAKCVGDEKYTYRMALAACKGDKGPWTKTDKEK